MRLLSRQPPPGVLDRFVEDLSPRLQTATGFVDTCTRHGAGAASRAVRRTAVGCSTSCFHPLSGDWAVNNRVGHCPLAILTRNEHHAGGRRYESPSVPARYSVSRHISKTSATGP